MQASQLESLRVQVVVPEGAGAAAVAKKQEEGEAEEGAAVLVTSPVAFPMLPIDRYGFLITDKCG